MATVSKPGQRAQSTAVNIARQTATGVAIRGVMALRRQWSLHSSCHLLYCCDVMHYRNSRSAREQTWLPTEVKEDKTWQLSDNSWCQGRCIRPVMRSGIYCRWLWPHIIQVCATAAWLIGPTGWSGLQADQANRLNWPTGWTGRQAELADRRCVEANSNSIACRAPPFDDFLYQLLYYFDCFFKREELEKSGLNSSSMWVSMSYCYS